MSKQVATPGPWFFIETLDQRSSGYIRTSPSPVPGMSAIARVSVNSSEGKANARLIAAAPDLLEACKAAMRLFPKEMRGSILEAAIAKAEGKQ